MARTKTITLDEKTEMIAKRIPNFSGWVRMQLYRYVREADSDALGSPHIAPAPARIWGEQNNKCNPKHAKGICKQCWGNE